MTSRYKLCENYNITDTIYILGSSVSLETGWTIVVQFPAVKMKWIFLFSAGSRPPPGPTHPSIQWVPRTLSSRVKRSGCETDHSPPSSVEVKNAWNYIPLTHGVMLS